MAQQYSIQYGVPYSILRASWVFQEDDLLNHFSLLENVNPAEPGHGFTTGHPWLRFGADADRRNVAAQDGDEDSVLSTYRRLIALRRASPALRAGTLQLASVGTPDVLNALAPVLPELVGGSAGDGTMATWNRCVTAFPTESESASSLTAYASNEGEIAAGAGGIRNSNCKDRC